MQRSEGVAKAKVHQPRAVVEVLGVGGVPVEQARSRPGVIIGVHHPARAALGHARKSPARVVVVAEGAARGAHHERARA